MKQEKKFKEEYGIVGVIVVVAILGVIGFIVLVMPLIDDYYENKYKEEGVQECLNSIINQVSINGFIRIETNSGPIVLVPFQQQ